MEYADVVRRRRMVRNFDPDRPVPSQVVERILADATHAPSAGFSQGWEFLLLTGGDITTFWATATDPDEEPDRWRTGMQRAPLLILPCAHKDAYLDRYAEPDKGVSDRDESRWRVPYWYIDTAMASLLMLLTVVDEGLGACFFGIPPQCDADVHEAFGIPSEYDPIGVLAIGYPAPDARSPSLRRGRRGVDQVTHHGRWDA